LRGTDGGSSSLRPRHKNNRKGSRVFLDFLSSTRAWSITGAMIDRRRSARAPLSMTKEKDQSGNLPMARPRAGAKISIPKESLR
jgi:hypothetical protein